MPTPTIYDEDVIRWSEEQAQFLLNRQFDLLDLEHLADEVLDVGKSEVRELENRMAVLLAHLIKWVYQPAYRSRSWELTINEQRRMIARRIQKTPSLKHKMSDVNEEFWPAVWSDARLKAGQETGIGIDVFPAELPWTPEQILEDGWLPDSTG